MAKKNDTDKGFYKGVQYQPTGHGLKLSPNQTDTRNFDGNKNAVVIGRSQDVTNT
jgi:hypothetical protein